MFEKLKEVDYYNDFDYQQDAKDHLLHQFRDSPKLHGFVHAILEPSEEWQKNINEQIYMLNLENARGEHLDTIGKLVNRIRPAEMNDEDYRHLIKVRISVNGATGSADNFIQKLKLLLPDGFRTKIIEQFPASVHVILYDVQDVLTYDIKSDILPKGVGGLFYEVPDDGSGKRPWTNSEVNPVDTSYSFLDPDSVLPDVIDAKTGEVEEANVVMANITFIV